MIKEVEVEPGFGAGEDRRNKKPKLREFRLF
jgi:hypothetical protein